MLLKLNQIIMYALLAFFFALVLYPFFIAFLQRCKIGKTIRENDCVGQKSLIFSDMHAHKAWTPNMGWAMLLIVMVVMLLLSVALQHRWVINNNLVSREETYIVLFAFFSLWLLWLFDDYLNVKWKNAIKWMSAKWKLLWMFLISWLMSRRFYDKLSVDYLTLWKWITLSIGFWFPLLSFFFTVWIVNAINITDGLDGLAWGMLIIVLAVLAVATFMSQLYIVSAVVAIVIAVLLAFLRYNINPAKIFMWDGGAFALAGLISSLVYVLNMRMAIVVPFLFLFLLFWMEIWSSALQMFWKKVFKKKLFAIAPAHHWFEHRGRDEWTVVMKAWLIQWILAMVTLLFLFYQFHTL